MVACGVFTLALSTASEAFQLLLVGRRGNGAHLSAALVLVAHQRLERDLGDDLVVRHRDRALRGEEGRRADLRFGALIVTVAATTIVWVTVTMLTPPTDEASLRAFTK